MFKEARCETCKGTGHGPLYEADTLDDKSTYTCRTCLGEGYVTLTDKTVRLPDDCLNYSEEIGGKYECT